MGEGRANPDNVDIISVPWIENARRSNMMIAAAPRTMRANLFTSRKACVICRARPRS